MQTAKPPDAHPLSLLHTVPGMGQSRRLVLLYAIHQSTRFPRGQELASSWRLVKCAKEAGGKRDGTSGSKIGNAQLTWAFAAAADLCLRENPAGPPSLAGLEKKHNKHKAVTILAHQ